MRPLLLLVALFIAIHGESERPRTGPGASEAITRLLRVDYKFDTESLVYEELKQKPKVPSHISKGKFFFQTIQYDLNGNVLAKFEMTECEEGPCNNVPPVYVSFSQGGNNIQNVYVNASLPNYDQWNFLYSVINTIYTPAESGEGDDQVVPTIYGRCLVRFGRPEDKKFRRQMYHCDVQGTTGRNFSRISGLDVVDYNQDVWYIQNTKIDADIVIIDAIELLSLRIPFNRKWGFQLESRLHIEITNRTYLHVDRPCPGDFMAEACAEHLGLTHVGKKLYEDVQLGHVAVSPLSLVLTKYREHLADMGDRHSCQLHASLFAEAFTAALSATEDDWKVVISDPENEPILPVIGNLLGSLGNSFSLKIAQDILFVEGKDFVDDYLFGAAQTTSNDEKWHKQLMYWLLESKEDEQLYWKIANTVATVLRRRCERTPSSWNACTKDKEKIVTKFITELPVCSTEFCHITKLESLYNLPLPQTYQLAKPYLCSSTTPSSAQKAALELINRVSTTFYDSQLVKTLVKVFRNTCKNLVPTLESQLAAEILVKSVLVQQNAATLILRSEALFPDDHEKWAFFYDVVEAASVEDELKEEFWRRMRSFRVFRPNYSHRSLVAGSSKHFEELDDFPGFLTRLAVSSHFSEGLARALDFSLSAKKGKNVNGLFGASFSTRNIDSYFGQLRSEASEPEASLRFSFLEHALPSIELFHGHADKHDLSWQADGQTIKSFEGSVILRDAEVKFPLLSGATVSFSSKGAAAFKSLSSAQLESFEKTASATQRFNISLSIASQVDIFSEGKSSRTLTSEFGGVTSFGGEISSALGDSPVSNCIGVDKGTFATSLSMRMRGESEKQSLTSRRVQFPGTSFRLSRRTTAQCVSNHQNRR